MGLYATGNTATIGFGALWGGTNTYKPLIESIDPPEELVDEIETSHLLTTSYKTKVPADLKELGDTTVVMQFTGLKHTNITLGTTGVIKITFPLVAGTGNTAAYVQYAGWVKSHKVEQITSTDKMLCTMVLAATGVPTWSAEAT